MRCGGIDRPAYLPTWHAEVCDHAVGATMKYNIDPEHIEAMRAAFHRVCGILQLNCDADDPMTEIIRGQIDVLPTKGREVSQ